MVAENVKFATKYKNKRDKRFAWKKQQQCSCLEHFSKYAMLKIG